MNRKERRARQSLWFLAGFSAAVFSLHNAIWLMKMIPPSDQRTRGQKVTGIHWRSIFKPCSDISSKMFWCHDGRLTCPIPSQSARSRALARAVDRPTTRTLLEVWEEMKLVLDTMTSNTGPLSSPRTTHNSTVQSECLCNKQSTLFLDFCISLWWTVTCRTFCMLRILYTVKLWLIARAFIC